MDYDPKLLAQKINTITVHRHKTLQELNTDFLFDYKIFPSHIMSHVCEWKMQERDMKVGDTIVQQIHLPPSPLISTKAIFGVRICEIIKEPNLLSFSYETLEGHVEKGISTFSLLQHAHNKIEICILTFSRPGNFLSKVLGPVFSIPYQNYCTQQALKHIGFQMNE